MVSSTTRKIFSLAISLLLVVISLTGVALGATAPAVAINPLRYTPGFSGAPGKMARDAAGNFYVADFWGKGIRKFNRTLADPSPTFIATNGRPSAVAVLPDSRLVVAMAAPQPYVAFYSQQTGREISQLPQSFYRPVAITVDASNYIYVLDAGDSSGLKSACNGFFDVAGTANFGKVRVYDSNGVYKYVFGSRTEQNCTSVVGGEFKQPAGIAYEKQNKQIVVVDTLNGRLQFFSAYFIDPTCSYVKSIGATAGLAAPVVGGPDTVTFGNPVDVAFEYTGGTTLNRIYVAERGRNEISVVDPVSKIDLKRINGTTVTGASMKFPSAVLFESTALGGMLYTNNAPTTTAADVMALAIDSGSIPVPAVALTMTAVAPTTVGTSLSLSGTVSPIYSVYCSANGGTDVLMTPSSNNWSGSVTGLTLNADNYILCKASDGTATKYLEAKTYAVVSPNPGPTVVIAQPAAGLVTKNASVAVSGTTTIASAYVKIDDALSGFTTTIQADASGNWSTTANLAEGSNVLSVTSWAPGTNVSGPSTRTVIADYTAPNLSNISFLSNGSTTNVAVQNLDGIVVDANLDTILVNGAPVAAKVSLSTINNTYFSVPVTLNRGLNIVTIQATDLAGNSSAVVTRTVTLDTELPAFSVTLPGDNSFMTGGSSATASGPKDSSYTTVTAAGATQTVTSGTWNGSFTVGTGFGSYAFVASGNGKTVELKRTIINGASAQLAITTPAADIATKNSLVTIAGNVATCVPIPTISVDGGAAVNVSTCNVPNFSHQVTLSSQGPHYVKVAANATTAAIRNIIYDTTPPDISIQADAHATPSAVAGVIEPSARISAIDAKLNGTAFSIPLSVITYSSAAGQSLWNADLSTYNYDEGSLAFTAIDPALNTTQLFYAKGVPTGDCNGDGLVNINDAILALRHVAHTTTLTGIPRFQCDVGGLVGGHAAQDGDIDITDAVLILGKSAGVLSF
jgi:hypothetical protein